MNSRPSSTPSRINPRIRNRVREICAKKGISLYALADRLGRAKATLYQIANGNRMPSDDLLVQMCDALGCEIGDLIEVQPAEAAAEK